MTRSIRPSDSTGDGDRFLSLRQIEDLTSLKKSTIYALIQAGSFPPPKSLTLRRRGWLASEVQVWIESRAGSAHRGKAA